jgi:hypothetical protein
LWCFVVSEGAYLAIGQPTISERVVIGAYGPQGLHLFPLLNSVAAKGEMSIYAKG